MKKTLKIYSTLARKKEYFEPQDPSHVKIYVCGPTVYASPHIGNARSAVFFDVEHRFLKALYPRVTFIRNITDIDDKIIKSMQETGQSLISITTHYTEIYNQAMASLGVIVPTHQPQATHYIDRMIHIIQDLVSKGFAYCQEGHVLFHVASHPSYGELSRKNREGMIAGARVEIAPYKKDPADFVLWKPSEDTIPGWDSPWGYGRPGWHIECSAMIDDLIGPTLDIHGGGQDLIFPHHENELAQSRCTHNQYPLARYWMHNGMLHIQGEKMSKSMGNIQTVDSLLRTYPGEVIRFALLSGHYRQSLEWNEELLKRSYDSLTRFYQALKEVEELGEEPIDFEDLPLEALYDDFNTPQHFSLLHELCTCLNKAEQEKDKRYYKTVLLKMGQITGFLYEKPQSWLQGALGNDLIKDKEIEELIGQRQHARALKNYTESDRIRDYLFRNGVQVEDTAKGMVWRRFI